MQQVLVTFDENLLIRVDIAAQELCAKNRSAFVRDACEYYLKVRYGIKNELKKAELHGMEKHD